ncbi:tryptophan/tyrosine permease [Actinidia rufa]|uniref:Tryptophan/tyrosine permease n=1 Tax=Actinidia rufa TaxID=165716 RepID=A0A7J0H4N7_9ERIC|nr:tryptophan/tyrosine permease [Actinidia rufa]
MLIDVRFWKNQSSSSSTAATKSSFKCFSQRQSIEQKSDKPPPPEEEFELERLFSNLNQATLKREPGSLTSAIFLVSGTTVGAGILAIPAVTQESGFLASAVTCILCWVFMVVTGLLIAEVNVNTMCELGSGGVSLVSMARRTIGTAGVQIAWYALAFFDCWFYWVHTHGGDDNGNNNDNINDSGRDLAHTRATQDLTLIPCCVFISKFKIYQLEAAVFTHHSLGENLIDATYEDTSLSAALALVGSESCSVLERFIKCTSSGYYRVFSAIVGCSSKLSRGPCRVFALCSALKWHSRHAFGWTLPAAFVHSILQTSRVALEVLMGGIMVADGKVRACFHCFWEVFATLEGHLKCMINNKAALLYYEITTMSLHHDLILQTNSSVKIKTFDGFCLVWTR